MVNHAILLISASVLTFAQALETPKVEDAAQYARTLVSRESLTNVNTVYQQGDLAGLPTSFVEYYADCGKYGNPVLLTFDESTSSVNIAQGSKATLSIRAGDHPFYEDVNPNYPGSRPRSVAGSPRLSLRGVFRDVTFEEASALEACFLERHPDARWWLPGRHPFWSSHFVEFEVDSVYFVTGFDDTGYIGEIPIELYKNATMIPEDIEGESDIMGIDYWSLTRGNTDRDVAYARFLMYVYKGRVRVERQSEKVCAVPEQSSKSTLEKLFGVNSKCDCRDLWMATCRGQPHAY